MHRELEYNAWYCTPVGQARDKEMERRKRKKSRPALDRFLFLLFFFSLPFLTVGLDGCLSKHLLVALHPVDRATKIDCTLASHPHAVSLAKKSKGNLEIMCWWGGEREREWDLKCRARGTNSRCALQMNWKLCCTSGGCENTNQNDCYSCEGRRTAAATLATLPPCKPAELPCELCKAINWRLRVGASAMAH